MQPVGLDAYVDT